MVIRPRAVAASILPLLAAPSAVWGFDDGATQRLYAALMKDKSELDFPDRAVDLEAVRQALADGADPNALVLEGSGRLATPQALAATPLAIAASRRDAGAIRILLEHKAAVNGSENGRAGRTQYTALHCAIMPFLYNGAPVSGSAGLPCRAGSARAVPAVRALLKGGRTSKPGITWGRRRSCWRCWRVSPG